MGDSNVRRSMATVVQFDATYEHATASLASKCLRIYIHLWCRYTHIPRASQRSLVRLDANLRTVASDFVVDGQGEKGRLQETEEGREETSDSISCNKTFRANSGITSSRLMTTCVVILSRSLYEDVTDYAEQIKVNK
jgi:predicted HAD superfamily hydrolase